MFVIQKDAAPKNGTKFCQKSIGVISCSLATPYDDIQHSETSPKVLFHEQTNKQSHVYRWCQPKNQFSTDDSILYIKDFSALPIGQTFARVLFVQVSLCHLDIHPD